MNTSGHVDWLAVTFPADLDPAFWLPHGLQSLESTTKNEGPHGYALTVSYEIGIRCMAKGSTKQGVHIVYSGEPLHIVREMGVSDRDLLKHALEYQGALSRLDVCVNVMGWPLRAQDLEAEYLAGRVKTRARGAYKREKLKTDEDTLYIGTGASERFFRAYNKGAQLHTGEHWLRLELETKKLMARSIGEAIAENNDTRAVINRAISDFVDFPDIPEYAIALSSKDVSIPKPERPIHSTYRWLIEIVAPALAKFEFDHPGEAVGDAFIARWSQVFADLQKAAKKK